VAAPTDEERAHHYLWRFWRHISRAGRVIIYDRSWYGRVLVERVENLIPPDAWRRAPDPGRGQRQAPRAPRGYPHRLREIGGRA